MKNKEVASISSLPDEGKKRGIRLQGPRDCIRLLNRLINKSLNTEDKFELDRLKAVTYAISTIVKVFEIAELEDRVKAIEEYLKYNKP